MNSKSKTLKSPFSIKLIYWIVNSLFWIMIVGAVVQLGDQLLYYFNITKSAHFTFSMPLNRNLLPITEVVINGTSTPFKVVRIIGGFNVWDLGFTFAIVRTITFYLNAFLFIYAVSSVKNMIINVKENNVFTLKNVVLLKRAAFVFFVMWLIKDVFMLNYVKLLYTNYAPYKNLFIETWLSNYLLLSSIILAIAHIFERGVKLQEYKNLTI